MVGHRSQKSHRNEALRNIGTTARSLKNIGATARRRAEISHRNMVTQKHRRSHSKKHRHDGASSFGRGISVKVVKNTEAAGPQAMGQLGPPKLLTRNGFFSVNGMIPTLKHFRMRNHFTTAIISHVIIFRGMEYYRMR